MHVLTGTVLTPKPRGEVHHLAWGASHDGAGATPRRSGHHKRSHYDSVPRKDSCSVKYPWTKPSNSCCLYSPRRPPMNGVTAIASILKQEGVEWIGCMPSNSLIEAVAAAGIRPIVCRQ